MGKGEVVSGGGEGWRAKQYMRRRRRHRRRLLCAFGSMQSCAVEMQTNARREQQRTARLRTRTHTHTHATNLMSIYKRFMWSPAARAGNVTGSSDRAGMCRSIEWASEKEKDTQFDVFFSLCVWLSMAFSRNLFVSSWPYNRFIYFYPFSVSVRVHVCKRASCMRAETVRHSFFFSIESSCSTIYWVHRLKCILWEFWHVSAGKLVDSVIFVKIKCKSPAICGCDTNSGNVRHFNAQSLRNIQNDSFKMPIRHRKISAKPPVISLHAHDKTNKNVNFN